MTEKEQKDMEVYIAKLQTAADRHGVTLAEYEDLCEEWYDLHDDGWDIPCQDDWIKQTVAAEADNDNPHCSVYRMRSLGSERHFHI